MSDGQHKMCLSIIKSCNLLFFQCEIFNWWICKGASLKPVACIRVLTWYLFWLTQQETRMKAARQVPTHVWLKCVLFWCRRRLPGWVVKLPLMRCRTTTVGGLYCLKTQRKHLTSLDMERSCYHAWPLREEPDCHVEGCGMTDFMEGAFFHFILTVQCLFIKCPPPMFSVHCVFAV